MNSLKVNIILFLFAASFSMIGQYFPIFFVGPVMAKFGKRISLMIDSVLFTIAFLLMTFSVEVYMLYVAKFFFGMIVFQLVQSLIKVTYCLICIYI